MKKTPHLPFWIITFGILVILVLPRLMQDGMFMDGVLYAAVAHNLAEGIGSFWHLTLSETMHKNFHEQPPLTFGLQAIFFKIFGSSIYVERGYSFLTLLITAGLISWLWRSIYRNNQKLKAISWLPVIFWITIPICFWSYSNNMEENTMGIFTLLSVIFIYKALNAGNHQTFLLIVASVCSTLAFLCKGFPGLFAITLPFIHLICYRSYSFIKIVGYWLIFCVSVGLIFLILFTISESRNSLIDYLNGRVFHDILYVSNQNSRFNLIVKLLFVELPLPLLLCIILCFLLKWKTSFQFNTVKYEMNNILFFISVGIMASFPLIITREQREFYLVTSLPYFAIAFSIIAGCGLTEWIFMINTNLKGFKIFTWFSILFLIGGVTYSLSLYGKTGRDKEKLHDVYLLGRIIPARSTIRVFPETWQDWAFQLYFVRNFNISMTTDTSLTYPYFISERNIKKLPPPVYRIIPLNTLKYDLYIRSPPTFLRNRDRH